MSPLIYALWGCACAPVASACRPAIVVPLTSLASSAPQPSPASQDSLLSPLPWLPSHTGSLHHLPPATLPNQHLDPRPPHPSHFLYASHSTPAYPQASPHEVSAHPSAAANLSSSYQVWQSLEGSYPAKASSDSLDLDSSRSKSSIRYCLTVTANFPCEATPTPLSLLLPSHYYSTTFPPVKPSFPVGTKIYLPDLDVVSLTLNFDSLEQAPEEKTDWALETPIPVPTVEVVSD